MSVALKIAGNGRVCIPADIRARLGLKEGDALLLDETENGIMLRTRKQAMREARALVRELVAGDDASVGDFIAGKRREATREEKEY